MSAPTDRSARILDQLIAASRLGNAMPVVHTGHRVDDDGLPMGVHRIVPVGPDVLVLACPNVADAPPTSQNPFTR
ncbi:hypothetical protein EON82_23530 [bacterium]|nr:MAG: hypothetical protein EON82_23530 [bacterium]